MLQVILEGIRGDGIRGDIAVDDISLTPGCSLLIGPLPAAGTSVTPGMHLLRHSTRTQPAFHPHHEFFKAQNLGGE